MQPLSLYPHLLREPGNFNPYAHNRAGLQISRRSSIAPKTIQPPKEVTLQGSRQYEDWINNHSQFYGKPPGIIETEKKFRDLDIPYVVSHPAQPGPEFDKYFDPRCKGDEAT
jgi:hypothetical protein